MKKPLKLPAFIQRSMPKWALKKHLRAVWDYEFYKAGLARTPNTAK